MRASAECHKAAVVSRGRSHRLCAWNAYTTVNAAYPEVLAFRGMFAARPVRTTAAFAHEQCADLTLAQLLVCPVCRWNPEILTGLRLPRWLRTQWGYGFQSRSIHRPNFGANPPRRRGFHDEPSNVSSLACSAPADIAWRSFLDLPLQSKRNRWPLLSTCMSKRMSAPAPEHLCAHHPHCGPTNKPFTLITMYTDVDIMVEMASTCPFSKRSYVTFSCVNSLNERWILDWKYSYLLFLIPLQPDHHAINVNDVCGPLCIMDEPAFILSNAEAMVVGVWLANGSAT